MSKKFIPTLISCRIAGLITVIVGISAGVVSLKADATDGTNAGLTPYDLQCEYLTNPLGIDVEIPRFSWKLQDAANVRGQKQTGYQILIASGKSMLEQDRADVWNSGKVSSSQSTLVDYGGQKLASDEDRYWKVRVFDKDGRPSAWSPVARFSMGLLQPEDWTGPWIKHPDAAAEKHIWFRKSFVLAEPVDTAFIHVASVGYHELYINGRKVDDRVLAPSLTRLDQRVFYVTYDIASLLKPGTNTIGIWTGPGWARYAYFKTHPALRVQLNARTADGKTISVASDATWRTEISSSRNTGGIHYKDNGGELIDAREYLPNWNAVGFDDSQWLLAATNAIDATLSAQMIPPTRIIETIPAQDVTEESSGNGTNYQVVLAKNFSGWLEIKFHGLAAGDVVTIRVSDNAETNQSFGQRNQYIAKGEDGEMFRNRFNYSAGRYITLEGLKQKPELSDVTGYAIGTDLPRTGQFSCSRELFNQIYEADLWTYRCNTIEGYTSDCPHRERLGYGEENFATAWGIGLPNYDSGSFYANMVRNWSDVQESGGWINHTTPQVNEVYGGPMWSSAGLNVAWEDYQAFADKRVLELNYPSSKRWLEFLNAHVTNGLLRPYFSDWGRFLGDWAAPGGRKERGDSREALYFNNCVYALNLETFIRIAVILNKPDDVALYSRRLEELKPHVQQEFFNPADDTYCGGNQVRQAFALLTGIVPDNLRPAVEANFENDFVTHPYFDMGSSGLPVLLKYLIEDSPCPDVAGALLSKTNEPSYGYFLARGESTWPEYWSGDVPSRIHTCYTGIAAWFTKALAGIRPDPSQPGYQHFLIKPLVPGDLTYAGASMESPYGLIESRWDRTNDMVELSVTVPPNSTATVYVPTSDASSATESGNDIQHAAGITSLGTEGKYAIFHVESGKYKFVARLKI